jgi:superfamily II DNA or RNA helicase
MSIRTNIEQLPWETRQRINKDLEIKIESKYGNGDPRYIYPFEIDEDNIKLPFAYAARCLKLKRPDRKCFPIINVKFEGIPRPEQKIVLKEAIGLLSGKGSVMISCFVGFGKTACAISIACSIGFKTLIIVNKLVLMKQWEESIMKFCPSATVQRLTTKSKKKECDFYIMNAQNVEKMGKTFFDDVGCVICDEAHLIMAETLSKSLQYVYPRYLIGLTATPYRPDGLDNLLEFYFGKYKIIRKLHRKHTAYKVSTGFKPKIEYSKTGRVNWGVVLDSQANDFKRNEMIIQIIQYFGDRNFLVLVKRVAQGEYLEKRFRELGEDVTSLLGSNQEFEVTSRILIGTNSKVGTGFDHPRLDALMLAADVEQYFIQYLGRVFRTKEVEPIIVDLVDNYGILNKHWNTRRKIYQDHGGTVKNFNLSNLE